MATTQKSTEMWEHRLTFDGPGMVDDAFDDLIEAAKKLGFTFTGGSATREPLYVEQVWEEKVTGGRYVVYDIDPEPVTLRREDDDRAELVTNEGYLRTRFKQVTDPWADSDGAE